MASDPLDALLSTVVTFEKRPYDYVMWAYPWGEAGTELEAFSGPEKWQARALLDMQTACLSGATWSRPYRIAMASGHDVGKSAFLCWVEDWLRSTLVGTRIRVTSVTEPQLRTTLWVEMAKWFNLSITRVLFKWTATSIRSCDPALEDTWRTDAMAWSKENPAAFAGIHNYGKRIGYFFDEAAGIPDIIYTVVDGVMKEADTELFWLAASQPLYNTGRFYDAFSSMSSMWHPYVIDSREVKMANKEEIAAEILARGGEEDDIVRVRIRGLFPLASQAQFFPTALLDVARAAEVEEQIWEPLILGVDVARRGGDSCVAQFRKGRDARSIPPLIWTPSPMSNPTMETGQIIASLITTHRPQAVFIDQTGYGAGVVDFLRHLGHSVYGVEFGSRPTLSPSGISVLNKRAEIYVHLREWFLGGGRISADSRLLSELLSIQFTYTPKGEIKLLSKEDMRALKLASPDWTDALALTFSLPVTASWSRSGDTSRVKVDYNPFAVEPSEDGKWERPTGLPPKDRMPSIYEGHMWRPN